MKKLLMLFVMLFACCMVVACGKEEERTSIKLGSAGPLAGSVAVYGTAVQKGVELAIEEINAAGGVDVNGTKYPFELVDFINDDADPTKSAAALNTLVGKDVDVVVGAVTSGATEGLIGEAVKVGVPVITPTGTADKLTVGEDGKQRANRENIFRACFYDSYQGRFMAEYAKEQGYEKVFILYNNDEPYSVGLKDAFTKTAEGLGVEIKSVGYPGISTVFDTYWATIKAEGYSCVYVPDYYEKVYSVVKAAGEADYEGVIYGGDGWDGVITQYEDEFDTSVMAQCVYTNHFFSGAEVETVKKFVANYKAKYNNEVPVSFAALGYDAVYMVKQAIEAADSVEYEAVVEALASTTFTGLVTSSEPFQFVDGSPAKNVVYVAFDEEGKEVEAK